MKKIIFAISLILILGSYFDVSQRISDTVNANQSCIGLKKVANLDELLLQMYRNIDNHCLFNMKGSELEEVWGIPVMEYSSTSNEEYKRSGYYDESFPSMLRVVKNSYSITVFGGRQDSSLVKGKFPILLPPPKQVYSLDYEENPPHGHVTEEDLKRASAEIPKNTQYETWTNYVWFNKYKSKNKPLLVISTDIFEWASSPTLYKNAESYSKHQPLIDRTFNKD